MREEAGVAAACFRVLRASAARACKGCARVLNRSAIDAHSSFLEKPPADTGSPRPARASRVFSWSFSASSLEAEREITGHESEG